MLTLTLKLGVSEITSSSLPSLLATEKKPFVLTYLQFDFIDRFVSQFLRGLKLRGCDSSRLFLTFGRLEEPTGGDLESVAYRVRVKPLLIIMKRHKRNAQLNQ